VSDKRLQAVLTYAELNQLIGQTERGPIEAIAADPVQRRVKIIFGASGCPDGIEPWVFKIERTHGWESIFHLMEEYEPLPETMSVITPSGGTHLYYAMPEGEPPVRCRVGWLPGVDIPWLVPVPPSARLVSSSYVPYKLGRQVAEPLPEAPSWVFADIRTRPGQRQRPIRKKGVRRRSEALAHTEPSQSQRHISTGGVRWHSEALPPTELFIENGLGWFTGSRDSDCFRLARRLWFQYGDEAAVVGRIFKAWEHTPPKDHPFTWLDAYHKIKQAERYWRADVEANRRLAELLMRWS
jgi:hypothetical protein